MNTSKILLLVLSSFYSVGAHAAYFPGLSKYFEQRITLVRNSTQSTSDPLASAIDRAQIMDINIDFAATASFGLSEVFKISISPEIDFVLAPNKAADDATLTSPM